MKFRFHTPKAYKKKSNEINPTQIKYFFWRVKERTKLPWHTSLKIQIFSRNAIVNKIEKKNRISIEKKKKMKMRDKTSSVYKMFIMKKHILICVANILSSSSHINGKPNHDHSQ